jgi:hypothetical protein
MRKANVDREMGLQREGKLLSGDTARRTLLRGSPREVWKFEDGHR